MFENYKWRIKIVIYSNRYLKDVFAEAINHLGTKIVWRVFPQECQKEYSKTVSRRKNIPLATSIILSGVIHIFVPLITRFHLRISHWIFIVEYFTGNNFLIGHLLREGPYKKSNFLFQYMYDFPQLNKWFN